MSQMISGAKILQQAVAATKGEPRDRTDWYTCLALFALGLAGVVACAYFGVSPPESGVMFDPLP